MKVLELNTNYFEELENNLKLCYSLNYERKTHNNKYCINLSIIESDGKKAPFYNSLKLVVSEVKSISKSATENAIDLANKNLAAVIDKFLKENNIHLKNYNYIILENEKLKNQLSEIKKAVNTEKTEKATEKTTEILNSSFGYGWQNLKLYRIDNAGFWFSFNLKNDKTAQIYVIYSWEI